MELFDVDSNQTEKALFDYADTLFKQDTGALLSIKGTENGSCLTIYNGNGPFGVFSWSCSQTIYSFCEFTRVPSEDKPGQ
jgi:hypothetical protein